MATVNIFGNEPWVETPEADIAARTKQIVETTAACWARDRDVRDEERTAVGAYQGFDMWVDELIKAAT
jgi:hypothetical protein